MNEEPINLDNINLFTIDIGVLAHELGLKEYELETEYYTQAKEIFRKFCDTIVIPETIDIPTDDMGKFILENADRLMGIFAEYSHVWRWPLCLLQEHVDDVVMSSIMQKTKYNIEETQRIIDNTVVILCFCLVSLRNTKNEAMYKKHGNKVEIDGLADYVKDEIEFQITTVWGRRYESLIKNILGEGNFRRLMPHISSKVEMQVANIHKAIREEKRQFSEEKRPERIFVANVQSKEHPESDVEALNFLLCQAQLYGFGPLIKTLGISIDYIPTWKAWLKIYKDAILNSDSQTHKILKYTFDINGDLFTDDILSEETKRKIPPELCAIIERWFIDRRKKEERRKKTASSVSNILASAVSNPEPVTSVVSKTNILPPLEILFDTSSGHNIIIQKLPEGVQKIELRVYNTKGKVVGFGNYEATISGAMSLTDEHWNNQSIAAVNPILLGTRFRELPEGEKYTFGVIVRGENWYTEESKTQPYIVPKKPKPIPVTAKKVEIILSSPIHRSTPTSPIPPPDQYTIAPEPQKDPKESEKEDLHTALEFFLEKSDQELMSFLQEHTQWDAETQILTLHIPVEELEEMGYTPSLLSVSEYGPMIQWSVKREKGKWTPQGEAAPAKIQPYYESIFRALSEQIERGEIDNYLSSIGLSPSETSDNSALKGAIRIQENIDIKKLDAGIKKMSEKYTQEGTHYNIYSGPLKDGAPTSISWFSKKQWRATLTLQSEIKIDLTPSNNQTLPYNAALLAQRIENALLNFMYQFIKNEKGISGVIKRTSAQENTKKLRASYRRELKKKTARLLVENPDGTFTIIEGISKEGLEENIREAQKQYGVENIALLYRRNTYTFLGDTSICKPSQSRSDDDYISLNLPERRNIIRERVLKTLFNGKSGIQDRAPFLYGSAVYHALQFEAKAFQEQNGRNITREDITDEFLEKFITILRTGQILISYRDYCAGEVENLTDLVGE